jgi:hypothetical protein
MNKSDSSTLFSRWYGLLVKNKMGGAALPIAGLAVGFLLLQVTRLVPSPYDVHVGYLGLRIMDMAAIVFCVSMVGFCFLWLRNVWKRKTKF